MDWKQTRQLALLLLIAGATACGSAMDDERDSPSQSDPTADGQFEDRDETDDHGRLTGEVLSPDGQPVGGATVYLRPKTGQGARTRSGNDGRFTFEQAPSGDVRVVVNDGRGRGALEEMTLMPNGTNELPPLRLQPIEQLPDIVDIPRIGFEERVTTGDGNYRFPVYSSDASRVYAARRVDGEERWNIVDIDTDTGTERVLSQGENLRTLDGLHAAESDAVAPSRTVFQLGADRYLVWKYRGSQDHTWLKIYDLERDAVAFDSQSIDGKAAHDGLPVLTSEALLTPLIFESRGGAGWRATAKRMKFYTFDFTNGNMIEGPSPGAKWTSRLRFRGQSGPFVLFQVYRACRDGDRFVDCPPTVNPGGMFDDLDYVSRLRVVRLDRLSVRTVEKVTDTFVESVGLAPSDPPIAYWVTNESGRTYDVVRENLGTETTTRRTLSICSESSEACSDPTIRVGANPDETFVSWKTDPDPDGDWTNTALAKWDVDRETRTPLEPTVEVDGDQLHLCQNALCRPEIVDGVVRVRRVFERTDGDWWGAMAEYRDGSWTNVRAIDIWEDEDGPTSFDVPVVSAAESDVEALRTRRGKTGFFQYSLRGNATEATGFARRTFLAAHHRHGHLSPDGTTLFYFTRDPVSGYIQLFRLRLDALPAVN